MYKGENVVDELVIGERVDVEKNVCDDELNEYKVLEMENENNEAIGENFDMGKLVKLIRL